MEPNLIKDKDLDFEEFFNKEDFEAYQTYVKLTSYENVFLNNPDLRGIIEEYSTRDATFPVDFVVGV